MGILISYHNTKLSLPAINDAGVPYDQGYLIYIIISKRRDVYAIFSSASAFNWPQDVLSRRLLCHANAIFLTRMTTSTRESSSLEDR